MLDALMADAAVDHQWMPGLQVFRSQEKIMGQCLQASHQCLQVSLSLAASQEWETTLKADAKAEAAQCLQRRLLLRPLQQPPRLLLLVVPLVAVQ